MIQTEYRQGSVLAYLFVVLVLGGASAAGHSANLLLQVLGAALIGWTLWSEEPGAGNRTGFGAVLVGLVLLAMLQFVPLPPALWQHLPGRAAIAEGYRLAEMPLPWLQFSLDPWNSLQSLVWWIPPLAILIALRARQSPETRMVIWVVLGVAYLSVVVAAVQVFGGSSYFYAITNRGNGVGLFANSNHFGSFMLVSIALAAGQWLHDRPRSATARRDRTRIYLLAGLLLPLVAGVLLSQSLACTLLLVPMAGGIALAARSELRINWILVGLTGTIIAVGMVWLLASGLAANDLMSKSGTTGISRGEFLDKGLLMARDFAPLGSGLGTFRDLYPWYEDAAKVGTTYVNHAHNDLLELVIETGIAGLAVLMLFLRWFVDRAVSLWNSNRDDNPVALTATLGIAAVLIHSLVDYPLRTAAVSSLIALSCVFVARAPGPRGAAVHDAPGAGKRDTLMNI